MTNKKRIYKLVIITPLVIVALIALTNQCFDWLTASDDLIVCLGILGLSVTAIVAVECGIRLCKQIKKLCTPKQ